jgi:F0F1-type ATP synthase assembly protein I
MGDKLLRDYAKYSGLGIQMAVSLGLPLYGGYWLDDRYGSSPWGILAGIALGLLSIFSLLYKLTIQSKNKP